MPRAKPTARKTTGSTPIANPILSARPSTASKKEAVEKSTSNSKPTTNSKQPTGKPINEGSYVVKFTYYTPYDRGDTSIHKKSLTFEQANQFVRRQFDEYKDERLEKCELLINDSGCLKSHICDQEGSVDIYWTEPAGLNSEWRLLERGTRETSRSWSY